MVQVVSEYPNQVGGRTKLKKLYGDHILKPTSEYEVDSYLKMAPMIAGIAPDCCAIISNGQLTPLRPCYFCTDPINLQIRNQVLMAASSGYFLIMKDVAHGLKAPRILDLKLGTRTHSDYLSEEKKQKRILKCLRTTSSTIGLRLSGASFNKGNGKNIKISKPTGLVMSNEDFVTAMATFFDISMEQKKAVVKRLKYILKCLEESESQRFFGSSLLVAIDDGMKAKVVEKTVRVKLIDFSSMARSEEGMVQYTGPDQGAMFGVRNLIEILEGLE